MYSFYYASYLFYKLSKHNALADEGYGIRNIIGINTTYYINRDRKCTITSIIYDFYKYLNISEYDYKTITMCLIHYGLVDSYRFLQKNPTLKCFLENNLIKDIIL